MSQGNERDMPARLSLQELEHGSAPGSVSLASGLFLSARYAPEAHLSPSLTHTAHSPAAKDLHHPLTPLESKTTRPCPPVQRILASAHHHHVAIASPIAQETGGTLGGQWVNQKWVSKNLNDVKKDKSGFDLTLWLKDTVLYMALLLAFTITIFAGRSTNQIVAFENVFRGIVSRHMANVNTHEDVLAFLRDVTDDIRNQEGNDFVRSDYEFTTEYGSAYGSGLVGPIRMRQVGLHIFRAHFCISCFLLDPASSAAGRFQIHFCTS